MHKYFLQQITEIRKPPTDDDVMTSSSVRGGGTYGKAAIAGLKQLAKAR
jgi:hypothetical protein